MQKLYNPDRNKQKFGGYRRGEMDRMRVAEITGQGLRWIAVLVTFLWGCIVAENSVLQHARLDTVKVLVELRQMRNGQRAIPARQPVNPHTPLKTAVG